MAEKGQAEAKKKSNPFTGVIKMKKMKPDAKSRAFGAELEKLRQEKKEKEKK